MTEPQSPVLHFPDDKVPEDIDDLAFLWEEDIFCHSAR